MILTVPSRIVCVDYPLQAPNFEFVSNARPSLFAYPAPTKPPKKEAVAKVATAVLSTTARAKAREKKKAAEDNVTQVCLSRKRWSLDVDIS